MDQPCLVVINHEVMMIVPDYTLTASEWTHSMAQCGIIDCTSYTLYMIRSSKFSIQFEL